MSEHAPVNRQQRRAAHRAEGHRQARERGQVTPDELKSGHCYVVPSHGGRDPWKIVSVGPKWITYRPLYRAYGTGPMQEHGRRRVLKSGWDGPYFLEVDAPAEA